MKKDLIPKVTDKVSQLKRQAEKLTQVIQTGVATSKVAAQKASTVINKKGLGQSVEVTSKGMEWAAKSARFASKGAQQIANSLDKASVSLKKVGHKLKD